jgi:hypothetical protein
MFKFFVKKIVKIFQKPEKVSSSSLSFATPQTSLENINIKIQRNTLEELVFELIGIDASIANAFRRIMISEVQSI